MGQQMTGDDIPENPFITLNPIHSPEMLHMFHGRDAQLSMFYRDIAIRQSVSLRGPRQIGKTTFLWCACQTEIQERFHENLRRHLFVLLDLRESIYQTAEGFFKHVSAAIARQARAHGLILQSTDEGAELYLSTLTQVFDHDFRLVLLLDSFDSLARNERIGPEFLSFLRSQSSNGNVTYVTASIEPLYALSHKAIKDSPFFNIFHEIILTELTRDEAEQLIREPAKRAGLPFTDTEVEWIVKNAGLHPCFILRACAVLFDEKLLSTRSGVSEQRFKAKAFNALRPLFQDFWDRLPEKERAVIRDEVQQKKHQGQLAQQAEQESEQPNRQFPELTESAFFRQFVRITCSLDLFKMNIEELKDALEKMHDLESLGETKLRLMKVVGYRLNGNSPSSPVERGKVIQVVLRDALENLRPSGPRADADPQWYSYNILDLRYYSRYRLKHREIAARLEFNNDRQYYRKREIAITKLLNVLFEMEELE
jgi:hypothetical protein